MKPIHATLTALIVLCCLSLVTSRHAQRQHVAATERARMIAKQLDQDYQNLSARQQQLEQTERIERIARQERGMDRIAAAKTVFVSLQGQP